MNYYVKIFLFFILISCNKKQNKIEDKNERNYDFVISFGSCDNQNITNNMWDEILKHDPNVFVWGGDIVYSDTQDMQVMKKNYNQQKNDSNYKNFNEKVTVMGTWDDHDYGLNDGGFEFEKKDSAQQLLLDFLDVSSSSIRRTRQGVYHAQKFEFNNNNSINIIVLDTRYFRTGLTKNQTNKKRYIPNPNDEGSILGKEQWQWLTNELNNSNANFNIIVSSIQFLSRDHGFESWGNMPHEVEKLKQLISKSNANGVIILSGDRHIAEISKDTISNLKYPLIDFTSSGLTHSYSSFISEPNQYRVSDVVAEKNFGILKFDLKLNQVIMEIRGENNNLYQSYIQNY